MNTKLNNWFIYPDFKQEYGIYHEFIDYIVHREFIDSFSIKFSITTYDRFKGYYNDDTDPCLSNVGFLSGNKYGYYGEMEKIPRKAYHEQIDGHFYDPNTLFRYNDDAMENDYYFYDGSGTGCGRGEYDGYCEN